MTEENLRLLDAALTGTPVAERRVMLIRIGAIQTVCALLVPVLVLAELVWGVECGPPGPTGAAVDGGPWSDVALPAFDLPDAASFMVATVEGGPAVMDPSPSCGADAAAAGGLIDAEAGDAQDAGACGLPLAPGDLIIDEVMISSVSGRDDWGQWLEVHNPRECSIDLLGLHAQAPKGASFHTLDVTTDVWLPAGGFFLIAESSDPSVNSDLPGLVLVWTDAAADVLHKTTDTVTLSIGDVMLDTLTYRAREGLEAVSLAFPANCAAGLRSDFSTWQPSTASWVPGFYGTPNMRNDDVRCSVAPPPLCVSRSHISH